MEDIYRREKLLSYLRLYKKLSCFKSVPLRTEEVNSNDDVIQERDLTDSVVANRQIDDFAIVVSNLHKQYDNVNAVRGINFTVKKG